MDVDIALKLVLSEHRLRVSAEPDELLAALTTFLAPYRDGATAVRESSQIAAAAR